MARRSAALLTKTQRRRIRNDFDDQSDAQIQRDRKRIRDRLDSGMYDCQLLATYPDSELEQVLDDCSTAKATAVLADAQLLIERLRVLQEIDRETLLERAQQRSDDLSDRQRWSVETADLRTSSAIQRETKQRLTPSRRLRWATRIMAIAGLAYAISVVLFSIDSLFGTHLWIDGPTVVVVSLFVCLFVGLSGWTVLIGATVVQYRLLPAIRRWSDSNDSEEAESMAGVDQHS